MTQRTATGEHLQPEIVSSVAQCAAICGSILEASKSTGASPSARPFCIAVDLEGRNLGDCDTGALAIVTVGTPNGAVFLFDTHQMQEEAFTEGLLGQVLGSPQVQKLFFDCRMDTAALFPYGVKLANVVDLQASAMMALSPNGQYVIGLKKVLGRLNLITASEAIVKEKGVALFAPELGGSYDVWFERPLHDTLLVYSAIDVKHLFDVQEKFLSFEKGAVAVGNKRVNKFFVGNFKKGGSVDMVRKDF